MAEPGPQIVIVTGMSGAGRTTCLKMLEDLDFEAVDNLPIQLLVRLIRPSEPFERSLAIGIDSRTRGLDPPALVELLGEHGAPGEVPLSLLFFDCSDEVLQRRFTESRRRHPMAADRPVTDGIARERLFLAPLRDMAGAVYDSSTSSLPDLRRYLQEMFGKAGDGELTLTVMSFAFRYGLPREADLVFDVRFLRNPHYVDRLRPLTGLVPDVQAFIEEDAEFRPTLARLGQLVLPLLPRYRQEGKSYLTMAIGCTGGKHRSVYMVESLGRIFREAGWHPTIVHRDIPTGPAGATERGPA